MESKQQNDSKQQLLHFQEIFFFILPGDAKMWLQPTMFQIQIQA